MLPNDSSCAFAFLAMNDSIVHANALSRPVLLFAGLCLDAPFSHCIFVLTLETFCLEKPSQLPPSQSFHKLCFVNRGQHPAATALQMRQVRIDNKAPSTGLIRLNRGALGIKCMAAVTMHDSSTLHFLRSQLQQVHFLQNEHGFAPQIWTCLSVSRLLLFQMVCGASHRIKHPPPLGPHMPSCARACA